jgi:Family of unknown function (DUF5681)
MAEEKDPKYTGGYREPPKDAQFKPGQSGNPAGRPRKTSTFEGDVEAELRSPITVLEAGERRRMTKRQAIVKQHVNRALKGDIRSTQLLLKLWERLPSEEQDPLQALIEEFREAHRRASAKDDKKDDK